MKIFGIGLSKTGTTSLANALEILGYRTRDNLGVTHYQQDDLSSIDPQIIEANDAFTDTPIPSLYRALDARYPGAKFILTVREIEAWLRSCKKQFTKRFAQKQSDAHNRLFMDLYGCTEFEDERFRMGYQQFVEGVLRHFQDRPEDLLILNVAAGEGWEKLCPFLNKPIPTVPFPKSNVTRLRWMTLDDLLPVVIAAGDHLRSAHLILTSGNATRRPRALGVMKGGRMFLAGIRYHLLGGEHALIRMAENQAQRIISEGLRKLSADVPIFFRDKSSIAFTQRCGLNHFWLVDIIDGTGAISSSIGNFSLNLALIEDRSPIVGAVYAPARGFGYLAIKGKGAFKWTAEAGKVSLGLPPRTVSAKSANARTNTLPHHIPDEATQRRQSIALALCCAESLGCEVTRCFEGTDEWQTAAAHVVLDGIGRQLRVCDTGEELTYNKEHWRNPPCCVADASGRIWPS